MKILFTFIFLLLTVSCSAQAIEVGYSPNSVIGWGKIPESTKFDLSLLVDVYQYKGVSYSPGIRYSYINSTSDVVDDLDERVDGTFHILFFLPASVNISVGSFSIINRLGFGFSNKFFPNENGMDTNFLLETGLKYPVLEHLSISARYSHISNADRGMTNPGVDNIIFATEFYF